VRGEGLLLFATAGLSRQTWNAPSPEPQFLVSGIRSCLIEAPREDLLLAPGTELAFSGRQANRFVEGGHVMEDRHANSSAPAVALAFLTGAIAGVIAGVLLAPKSGEETRRALRGYAKRTEEEVIEKAKEARAALDDMIERGKHFVEERKADVEAAFKAGREAMKERRERIGS
jgi:gas vesicle protein